MAVPGSLRRLENAFISEGGEIEKRKAFVLDATLTAYCQAANYKNRVTGPFEVPGVSGAVFFRHRHDSLPSTGWTAGAGSVAVSYELGSGLEAKKFWAMKSTLALADFGLFHGASYSEFSNTGYVVEEHVDDTDFTRKRTHVAVTFTGDEPTAEAAVAANANRAFQRVLDGKGYVVSGVTLYASAVADITNMAGTGSGAVDLTTQGQPIGKAIALADYYGQLAIFGERGVQFFSVDADFAQNQYQRTVSTSLLAPRSAIGFGDGDVLYLGRSGVRSLQARDSSNLARVSDVGSPIDREIRSIIENTESEVIFDPSTGPNLDNGQFINLATAIVHTETGHMWLCIKDRVYVLSRYPSSRVLAWSSFTLPAPRPANESVVNGRLKSRWVADIAKINDTLVFRNFADEVYVYGGADGQAYDSSETVVELPFMDMGTPGTSKYFKGIDLVCEGEWDVEVALHSTQFGNEPYWHKVAEIRETTRYEGRISFDMQGVQIAVRLTSRSPYAARLSQIGIFFQPGSEK